MRLRRTFIGKDSSNSETRCFWEAEIQGRNLLDAQANTSPYAQMLHVECAFVLWLSVKQETGEYTRSRRSLRGSRAQQAGAFAK